MNAIQKPKILCSIILLIVFFGACSTKKQLTSSSKTAVAVDTATHQTAFQSLKPKPTYYLQFNSQLNNIPTPKPKIITSKDLYEFAFEDLKAMLEGKDSVDFEKAIFITENVYYRNKVKYDDYLRVLDHHTKRINALITANDKSASMDFKVYANFRERGLSYTSLRYTESEKKELYRKALTNWAIFTYLTDTLTFGQKQQLPFAYQIDDPFGMDNWSNSQVLHLLGSMEKKGNCFALVALFKIFSNRLNSEAYICTAPQHIYLQHRDEKGDFYNLELATKTYPSDGTLMTLTFTHKEAIMSGISLRRLKTDKQNIVLCLVNLGKSYEHKFETREDDFMLKCAELALQHDSLNLNAMLLKQQVLEERVMKFAIADSISSIAALQTKETFKQLEKHILHLYDKGYHQMPLYMQEIILSKLQQDKKPLVIKDRTPNPFTSIKVPANKRRYSTLSGGLYEEVHVPKQFEEYGHFVLDTKNRKLVKFTENSNKELLIDPVVFAWSVDPMAHERVSWTPYNAFRNNPILNIDPTGALDTKYVDEDGNELANTNDGIDRTVTVKNEQKQFFESSMQMGNRNNWTDNPTFNTILSDKIDQSNFNSTAAIRSNIGAVADSHIGETTWNKDVRKDNFGAGTWKCNKFVFDVINESGLNAPTTSGGWPLNAGAWGDKNTFIKGWTILSNNFQPSAGDVAAESHNYTDATGHTGIVSQFGQTTSATNSSIVRNNWGFRTENQGVTVFRRYIGR